MPPAKPLVAIEPDVYTDHAGVRLGVAEAYGARVAAAGGTPVVLTPSIASIPAYLALFDAYVFTGGDDPRTEPFGVATDPRVTPVHETRQSFATALLGALRDERPAAPVLGVCLGMQMMTLVAGGALAQHMPESHPASHADHWGRDHEIRPAEGSGLAGGLSHSRHRQCVSDPGPLRVAARAPDGVIEAVDDPGRRFFVGVQWHPERTADAALGQHLFDRLVGAAKG